jgi:hypothetical protein
MIEFGDNFSELISDEKSQKQRWKYHYDSKQTHI